MKKYLFRIALEITIKSKKTNEFECLYFNDEDEFNSELKILEETNVFISKRWVVQYYKRNLFFLNKWVEMKQLVNDLSVIDIKLRSKTDAEILLKYYHKGIIEAVNNYFIISRNSRILKLEELIYKEFNERNSIIFVPNSWCKFKYKGNTYLGFTKLTNKNYDDSAKVINFISNDGSTGFFSFVAKITYLDDFKYIKSFVAYE